MLFWPTRQRKKSYVLDLGLIQMVSKEPNHFGVRSLKFRMNLWSHSFSQNTNEKLSGFLPCKVRVKILTIFCSYFGRNDDFIKSYWNQLTFSIFVIQNRKLSINGSIKSTAILAEAWLAFRFVDDLVAGLIFEDELMKFLFCLGI